MELSFFISLIEQCPKSQKIQVRIDIFLVFQYHGHYFSIYIPSEDEGDEYELEAEDNRYIEVKLPEKDRISWINQTSSFDTKSSKTRKSRQNVKRIIARRNC